MARNGRVDLLQSNLCDNNNYLYFDSTGTRDGFFDGQVGVTSDNCYFIKENQVRTPFPWGTVRLHNYMRFKNPNYTDTWFYCFITRIEYINDSVTTITFELDDVTNWVTGQSIANVHSFVMRNHTSTDILYDNIVKEPELIDNVERVPVDDIYTFPMHVMLTAIEPPSGSTMMIKDGVDGFFIGHTAEFDNLSDLTSLVQQYATNNRNNSIIDIVIFPQGIADPKSVPIPDYDVDFNGYVPKNKKLYCYLYCGVYLTNYQGTLKMYGREFFYGNKRFIGRGIKYPKPEAIVYPDNYMGDRGIDDGVSTAAFSTIQATASQMQSYWAKNASNFVGGLIAGGLQIGTGVAAKAVGLPLGEKLIVSGAVTGMQTIASGVSSAIDSNFSSGNSYGTTNAGVLNFLGKNTVGYGKYRLEKNNAIKVDNFFSVYGYAINKQQLVQINNRPNWTFIQCDGLPGFNAVGDFGAKERISQRFSNGVWFWKNYNTMGDFSQPNEV